MSPVNDNPAGARLGRASRHRAVMAWVIAAAIVLGFAGWGAAASTGSPTIRGCYQVRGGALRVVPSGHCGRGERAISWNQRGPAGPSGVTSVPAGSAVQYNGNGGTLVPDAGGVVDSLTTANHGSTGPLKVSVPSRLVVNGALTLLGSGTGVNLHAECHLAVGPVGGTLQGIGAPNFVTLVNTAEYRDMALTAVGDVAPGSYDVAVSCNIRDGAVGHASLVVASLTATAEPQ